MENIQNIEVHIGNLLTLPNYAKACGITRKALDFRIAKGHLHITFIDGVRFIDTTVFPPPKKYERHAKNTVAHQP